METFKEWETGVQIVRGFAEIYYRIYLLVKGMPSSAEFKRVGNIPERIQLLETARGRLLESGCLVSIDTKAGGLWIFGSTEADVMNKLPLLNGCLARKSETRADPGLRWISALHNTKEQFFIDTDTEAESGFGVVEASQAVIGQVSARGFDFKHFHGLFLTAIVSSISYSVARHGQVVPLNFCTFVAAHPVDSVFEDHINDDPEHSNGLCLNSLRVQLTSAGDLLISSISKLQPGLQSLQHARSSDMRKSTFKSYQLIRIAPNGVIARVKAFGQGLKERSIGSSLLLKDAAGPNWQSSVFTWLRRRGIYLENLADESAWVQILISNRKGEYLVDWPLALCFYYDSQCPKHEHEDFELEQGVSDDFSALQWFDGEEHLGFEDPLDFPQTWISDKKIRDEELENRRTIRAERATEAKRISIETPQDQFASPFSRIGPFGDSQNATGVYPTPPDGLPPHATPSFHHTSFNQTVENSTASEGGAMHDFDQGNGVALGSPPKEPQGQSRSMSLDFDAATSRDFFVDEDGDLLEAADMTEADFSFFDEPDIDEDKVMLNTDGPNAGNREIDKYSDGIEDPKVFGADSGALVDISKTMPTDSPRLKAVKLDNPILIANAPEIHISNDVSAIDQVMRNTLEHQSLVSKTNADMSNDEFTHGKSPIMQLQNGTDTDQNSYTQTVSLDAISFDAVIKVHDEKYSVKGRFGGPTSLPLAKNQTKMPIPPMIPHLSSRDGKSGLNSKTRPAYASKPRTTEVVFDWTQMSTDEDTDTDYDSLNSQPDLEAATLPQYASTIDVYCEGDSSQGTSRTVGNAQSSANNNGAISSPITRIASLSRVSMTFCLYYLTVSKPMDWSLVDFPAPQAGLDTLPTSRVTFSKKLTSNNSDFVAIAQILVEQLTLSTHLSLLKDMVNRRAHGLSLEHPPLRSVIVQDAVARVFSRSDKLDLHTYACTEGISNEPPKSGHSRPRQIISPSMASSTQIPRLNSPLQEHPVFQIPSPHVRITKTDSLWDVFPPALSFWDTLGLGPCDGPKDVAAYCVYPFSDDLDNYMERFLETIGNTYETLKLGTHAIGESVNGMTGGLIPVRTLGATNQNSVMESVKEVCLFLARGLAKTKNNSKCLVVYVVDPFKDSSELAAICSCFWEMCQMYGESLARLPESEEAQASELILQIIPIDLIASKEYPIVLEPDVAAQLAREVYDRCPLTSNIHGQVSIGMSSGAAIQLEAPIPRSLQFQLTPEPAFDLVKENSQLHLAYARSLDDSWVTAAWIDNTGENQAAMSYYLTGDRTFADVAKEIWEKTVEIIKRRRVTWRLFLVKAGYMTRDEKETWRELVSAPKAVLTRTAILSIDTCPNLALTPKSTSLDSTYNFQVTTASQIAYTTPVNTPGAVPGTPDQHLHAPTTPSSAPAAIGTPTDHNISADIDPNSTLTDVAEETWGVILANQLNTSPSIIDWHPAIASGYLMKRGGLTNKDGLILMEVNLTYCELAGALQCQRGYDALLKETLVMYNNLGVLARMRGVEGIGSVRPWHIATAIKGTEGLSKHMPAA